MLVRSSRCDSLAGGQPEHADTDGVGGMAASWPESRRQRLRANTGSKISGGFTLLSMPRSENAEFPIRKQGKVFPILRKIY